PARRQRQPARLGQRRGPRRPDPGQHQGPEGYHPGDAGGGPGQQPLRHRGAGQGRRAVHGPDAGVDRRSGRRPAAAGPHPRSAARLTNTSNFDAAVTLTVDGLNVFAFSEVKDATGDPKFTHLILKKKSAATIKGWYRTSRDVASFLVTDLPKSAGGVVRSSSA